MSAPTTIVVVNPNPALQKTLVFDAFTPGAVNRASSLRTYTGGKGTNFARAAHCYRFHAHHAVPKVCMFLGGESGARVNTLLSGEGIETVPIAVPSETRTCVTCLGKHDRSMTELIEPSHAVPDASAVEMDGKVRELLKTAGGLAIMGSLPDGTDSALYARWVRIAAESNKPVLLDAVKGVDQALRVEGASIILKVNKEELQKMTGQPSVEEAFAFAMREWSLSILAVTDGPDMAFLQARGQPMNRYRIDKLDNVINPLGAGDTADAVLFSELLATTPAPEAFRRALAAASANCLQEDAGVFEQHDYEAILTRVHLVS